MADAVATEPQQPQQSQQPKAPVQQPKAATVPATDAPTYMNAVQLRAFVQQLFMTLNVPEKDAYITADVLVQGDLRGVDSHGVARLFQYIKRLQEGLIEAKPTITIKRETPVSVALDGGNGLGQVVSHQAMEMVIDKAAKTGIGMATVNHSNHFGIAGYYAMMALQHGMVGQAYTNTTPLVMPTFGKKIMTGTNPIAVAVPCGSEKPWVLDMATSVVPRGKLEVAARKGLEMPQGWAVDKEGVPTTDPQAALDGGAPMPLGGTRELGGHKGYDLAIFVDILSGVLSGAGFGPNLAGFWGTHAASNIGHFFMAFRPDLFMDLSEFESRMDEFVRELKATPPTRASTRVLVAGQPEDDAVAKYRRTGVPLHPKVMQSLTQLSEELGVPLPSHSQTALG